MSSNHIVLKLENAFLLQFLLSVPFLKKSCPKPLGGAKQGKVLSMGSRGGAAEAQSAGAWSAAKDVHVGWGIGKCVYGISPVQDVRAH